MGQADATQGAVGAGGGLATYFREGALGENTADEALAEDLFGRRRGRRDGGREQHSHEQTGLSTGTVADNDELSTDLRHGGRSGRVWGGVGGIRELAAAEESQQVRWRRLVVEE
jgi:uncharacterized caspase-like protein